jgi:hypothetical protein
VHEDSFGIRSSAAPEWSVCEPHSLIYACDLYSLLAGEVCHDWQSWGVYLGIDSILGQSLLQSTTYILLSVREFPPLREMLVTYIRLQTAFASSATVLVISYAP